MKPDESTWPAEGPHGLLSQGKVGPSGPPPGAGVPVRGPDPATFGSGGGGPQEEEEEGETPPKVCRRMQEQEEIVQDLQLRLEKSAEECDTFATRARGLDAALTKAARDYNDSQQEVETLRSQLNKSIEKQQQADEEHSKLQREWKDEVEELQRQNDELKQSTLAAQEDHRVAYQAAAARETWMEQVAANYRGELAAMHIYQELAFQYGLAQGKDQETVKREALDTAARAHQYIQTAPTTSATAAAEGGTSTGGPSTPLPPAQGGVPSTQGTFAFTPTGMGARPPRSQRPSQSSTTSQPQAKKTSPTRMPHPK